MKSLLFAAALALIPTGSGEVSPFTVYGLQYLSDTETQDDVTQFLLSPAEERKQLDAGGNTCTESELRSQKEFRSDGYVMRCLAWAS